MIIVSIKVDIIQASRNRDEMNGTCLSKAILVRQNDRLEYLPYAHSVELLNVGTHCHYCLGQNDLSALVGSWNEDR